MDGSTGLKMSVSLRLSTYTEKALQCAAEKEGISMGQYIEKALAERLARFQPDDSLNVSIGR